MTHTYANSDSHIDIQGDPGGRVNNLWGDIVGKLEKKKVNMNVCLILKSYWATALWISRANFLKFFFVGLDEEWSLQNKGGYTDELLARILDAAACKKKREDQLRRTTRELHTHTHTHTSCKVHWGWRWDLRTFIVNYNTFLIKH